MSRPSATYISAALAKYAAPAGTPSIGAPSQSGPKKPRPQDPYAEFNRQADLFKPKQWQAPGPLKPSAMPQPKPAEQLTKITPNPTGGTISLNTPTAPVAPITVTGNSSGTISTAPPQSPTVPTTSGPSTPVTPLPATAPPPVMTNVPPSSLAQPAGIESTISTTSGPVTPAARTASPGAGGRVVSRNRPVGARSTKFDTFAEDMIATGKQPEGAVIDMTQPVDTDFITQQISDEKIPVEQRQSIAKLFVQDHVKQNPMLMEGLQDIQAGKTDTEAARAFMSKLDEQKAAFIQAHPQEAATPQGFGQLMQQWEAMPFASKAMMGVGLPLGLIGIMSSLFGKGGMGMGIMGLLGLGAAGLGGATGGMFGEGAQNAVNDAAFNMGQFMGMVPEQADLSILNNEDPAQALIQGDGKPSDGWFGPKVETVQRQLTEGKEKAEQLRKLLNAPIPESMKIHFMRRLDPSIGDGRDAFARAQRLIQQYDDPQSALGRHIRTGEKYVQAPWTTGFQIATGQDPLAAATPAAGRVQARHGARTKRGAYKFAFNAMDAKELADLKAEQAKKYDLDNARRLHELEKRKQVSASPPKTKKTVVVVACQKAAQEKDMNLEHVFKKWAAANTPCSCGCGDTVATCKCSADCKCRKPGGSCYKAEKDAASTPAWQREAGKNDEGGLNAKGRASYNNSTGGNLKAPVTESNPKGDRAKRQNSFCSRMCGMKKHETGAKTKQDPDSRINKSLRKWNCKCSSASELITKAARCWAGYEPVPGAKAYSRGSCRPKGSKKTQKEMKKQSTEGTSYGQTSHLNQSSRPD